MRPRNSSMSYYYVVNQQQQGPVTEAELVQLAQNGTITSATLVWNEGMADWRPLGEVLHLTPPQALMTAASLSMTPTQPSTYAPPVEKAPGIGRLVFFLSYFAILALSALLAPVATSHSYSPLLVVGLAISAIACLAHFRLKNVGKPAWFTLLMLVPVINVWPAILCAAAPAGYHHTKKLDTAGKIIIGLFIGLILVNILAGFLGV